ncbi:MAG: DUF1836 domain-containing protein [Lachnospiraceae bacterium]|nr:DUF1836 domain-containing protein [Lachnospiraceae bacterium]
MRLEKQEIMKLLMTLQNTDYVRPDDLPDMGLYMDQVTTFMNEHLKSSKRFEDDKILTKTMINNYTKNDLLPPPEKKKYSKEHMLLLLYIYYLKNFLSISDIRKIIDPLMEDYFHSEKNGLNLSDLYNMVVENEEKNVSSQVNDIIKKLKISMDSFEDIEDEEDRKILTDFMFICMLSFDVYLKKRIIENIIDGTLGDKKKD